MSPFQRSGGGATNLPTLSSASHGTTTPVAGTMTATPLPITTLSANPANPTPLLSGYTGGSSATVQHVINLGYSIPAHTLVGTYQATITVTTGDGP